VRVRRRDDLQSHQVPPRYGCDDHDLAMRDVWRRASGIQHRLGDDCGMGQGMRDEG